MPERTDRPLVIQTEHLDAEPAAWLAERARLEACSCDETRFGSLLPEAEGLLIRTYTRVDAELLARAPKLKVVARAGVGLDNVDVSACLKRGVRVVSTPGANTRAVVEYAWTLLLDELRPRMALGAPAPAEEWRRLRTSLLAPRQLSTLTLGIVGFGRVGSAMARVAAAFDMRIVYHDLVEIPEGRRSGARPASLEETLESADVLSLHVDARAANRHLIDGRALARLKPDAILLNTSRGFVVDAAALSGHLERHPQALAILDVHDPEPPGPGYPLWGVPNCRIYPHLGAATAPAHRNMSWVVLDLWRVLSGQEPENPALPDPIFP